MTRLEALLAYQQTELEKERAEAAVRSTPARVRLSKLHRLLKTQQATIARLNEELEARAAQASALWSSVTTPEISLKGLVYWLA